jgi:hypothetical protein
MYSLLSRCVAYTASMRNADRKKWRPRRPGVSLLLLIHEFQITTKHPS